jgi:eukaryotic-like serine/threonine-protein kinase
LTRWVAPARVARVLPSDCDQAKQIFGEALPLAAPERERLLASACAGRERLRIEVDSLLDAHERAGGFLLTGATASEWAGAKDLRLGQRLGPYVLESVLGQGGMGVVYRARREAPARDVAIKVVRLGPGQARLVRRFEIESRVLARLDHPHIAHLFDVGATPDGRPYFVLELADGHSIDRHCAQRQLQLRERLELFLKLCDAVSYAHGRLVVHRDLKPGNVLVTPDGTPKLLDFGIAHLLDEGLAQGVTETGLRLMTPAYASPEQMRGEPATVATDIHALGLLLHLLLTGRGAFQLKSGAAQELVRVVCLDDAPAPSVDLGRTPTDADRFEPVEPTLRLARMLRGDLDSIVARALRKEPQARYPSVAELEADVRRYLNGEPVLARGGRFRYRAGKFVRRQRLPVALVAGLLLAILAGLATTLWQARVARVERARAERRFADVRRLATSFLFDFHDAIRDLPGSTRARELVVAKATKYLEGLAREAGQDPALQLELARAYQRVGTVQGISGQANLGDATGAARSLTQAWALLGRAEPLLRAQPELGSRSLRIWAAPNAR